MVDSELLKNFVELVVHRDRHRRLDHVRSQINPLLKVLLYHIQDHILGISFSRVDINVEIAPVEFIVVRCRRESILLIVIQCELARCTLIPIVASPV